MTLLSRVLAKLDRTGPSHPLLGTPCWIWTGWADRDGYGILRTDGTHHRTKKRVHRVVWEALVGEIPDSTPCVLHHCDTPRCCNPDHCFLGTNADNNADRVRKGRSRWGSRHPMAKLSEMDVQKIRRLVREGRLQQKDIAVMFGVAKSVITNIKMGRRWALLGDQHETPC